VKALMSIFKEPGVTKACLCYDCYAIRGYWRENYDSGKGIWVAVMHNENPCSQCGSREMTMLRRSDGCVALVREWG